MDDRVKKCDFKLPTTLCFAFLEKSFQLLVKKKNDYENGKLLVNQSRSLW